MTTTDVIELLQKNEGLPQVTPEIQATVLSGIMDITLGLKSFLHVKNEN